MTDTDKPILATTFKVGRRYRCTMSLPAAALRSGVMEIAVAWEPDIPRRLTHREMRDYRRGRDAVLAEASRLFGAPVAMLEI